MLNKTCILIAGPTASGKTALALQLAQHFRTEIISADSRQCFRELNIGVAKPSPEQRQLVKHHFINSHTVYEEVNAAVFEQYALEAVQNIFSQHDVAIMAGGTGLYIRAFCEGMDDIPVIPPGIRLSILAKYKEAGLPWLQEQVQQADPSFPLERLQNPQRLMRALEVNIATGRSIHSYHTPQQKKREFNILKIGLDLPREALYRNINHRVNGMIAEGLKEEATALLPLSHLNALNTVGYKEWFACLNHTCTPEEAVEAIKKNTRHYAKRQLTWFKKDAAIRWFAPEEGTAILHYLDEVIARTKEHG